jgi:glycosidase
MPERAPKPYKVNNLMAVKPYFLFNIQIRLRMWERLRLSETMPDTTDAGHIPEIVHLRRIAERFNRLPETAARPVPAGHLHLYGLMIRVFRYLIDHYTEEIRPRTLEDALESAGIALSSSRLQDAATRFAELFPGAEIVYGRASAEGYVADDDAAGARKKLLVKEMLLLSLAGENPALDSFRQILDDAELSASSEYRRITASLDQWFAMGPPIPPFNVTLLMLLRAPLMASPRSLAGQAEYIRKNWLDMLPSELLEEFLTAIDIVREEEREFHGGPGHPMVLEFLKGRFGYEYPEYERFSADSEWMPNVIMIAKMAYVWLGQLAKKYGRPVERLDQVPDEELDRLARWGFTALWLIGLWERSPASARIKRISGNPEAAASAYSLYDYTIAADLGGEEALGNLKERCQARGIRLASDMVPNHTGIYSRWVVEHPDWFIQLDYPPYPAYSFNGPDLSFSPEISLNIDDGYWERRDAAVVFKHYDHRDGRTRYIYHGNDGTSTPWNDTAQLNYLLPQVREAVIRTILHVARQFPIIRFDAAMTLAKKHYQRLWYPQPGHGSGVPSRAEHGMTREEFDKAFPEEFWREVVDRVAAEAPGTLLLAEAFWLMEGYFVRTLGMHRVYNSAFMNMLKMEENAKYRQTVKNVLEYDHRILQRFVNFMNNPDERTAVEQFGKEGKYFGACVLLVTMPGLPMIGHGQVEGFHEKYGMEYQRAYWDEAEDEHLVAGHEARIFPLMGRRRLFSGSENFVFYDFFSGDHVDENVFAYSNSLGGEHGLILYHNRYADTAGWIRTSTAIAVKNERGETILVQKTLGEALGCNPDGRCYYSFRDYSSGLEHLRSGMEICSKGLYAQLGSYEYRAFLDFREIRDDEFGSWGKLCTGLNGRGVASLDEELKQVRYAALIEAFRLAVEEVALYLESPSEGEEREMLRSTISCFYAELNRHTSCSGDCQALADLTMNEIAVVCSLKLFDTQAEEPGYTPAMEPYGDRLLLAAWLILHEAGSLAAVEDQQMVIVSWLGELGLELAFRELAIRACGEAAAATLGGEGIAHLLRPLIRWQRFFAQWEMKDAPTRFTLLFADPGAREFLKCHPYEEQEWFNRERFKILLGWFVRVEEISMACGAEPGALTEGSAMLNKRTHLLQALAEESGYRLDRFLLLLRPADEE